MARLVELVDLASEFSGAVADDDLLLATFVMHEHLDAARAHQQEIHPPLATFEQQRAVGGAILAAIGGGTLKGFVGKHREGLRRAGVGIGAAVDGGNGVGSVGGGHAG